MLGARFERWGLGGTRVALTVAAYTLLIAAGEVSLPFVGPIPVAIADAAIMVVLVIHASTLDGPPRRLLAALGLVAMLRTLSVAAALPGLPAWAWYPTVGLPVLAGLLMARTRLGTRPTIGVAEVLGDRDVAGRDWAWLRGRRLDLVVAAAGIPAGLLGYLALRPASLVAGVDLVTALAAIAGLVVGAAVVEELLLRGILQAAAIDVFGDATRGVILAAAISTLLYLGAGSFLYLGLMLALSLTWGLAVARGASLLGTSASHAALLVGAGVVWPLLLR